MLPCYHAPLTPLLRATARTYALSSARPLLSWRWYHDHSLPRRETLPRTAVFFLLRYDTVGSRDNERGRMAGRITALAPQRGRRERLNVFLDGRFAFGMDQEAAARAGLHVGMVLDA